MKMKKNLLIILPMLPYPLTSGGRQGVFSCINAIKEDFNIIITCYNDYTHESIEELNTIWPNIKILPYKENRLNSSKYYILKKVFQKLMQRIFKNDYLMVLDKLIDNRFAHFNPQYYDFINKIIIDYNIDIVQCEFMSNLALVYALPSKVKKVFIHHELGYVRDEQMLKSYNTENSFSRFMKAILKDNEIRTLSQYDVVITHSTTDTSKLLQEGVTSKVFSSFSMVKTDQKSGEITSFDHELSFVGPESHLPNRKGLEWFLNDVWPLLLSNSNMWHLKIIGKWTKETISEWGGKYDNVRFTGYVDSLSDALRNTIMIVPIQIGSGIRMKLQEAAIIGVPFVSTTVGAEGLPFIDGKDCYIADSPEKFATSVIKLSNISIQKRFVVSAYNTISAEFSVEKLRQSRIVAYNSL